MGHRDGQVGPPVPFVVCSNVSDLPVERDVHAKSTCLLDCNVISEFGVETERLEDIKAPVRPLRSFGAFWFCGGVNNDSP